MSMSSPVVSSGSSSRSSSVSEEYEQRPAYPNTGSKTSATDKDESSWDLGQATDSEESEESEIRHNSDTESSSDEKIQVAQSCCVKISQRIDKSANTCKIINASLITAIGITQLALSLASLPELSDKISIAEGCRGDGVTSPCKGVTDIHMVDILSPAPMDKVAGLFTEYSSVFITTSGMIMLTRACWERLFEMGILKKS